MTDKGTVWTGKYETTHLPGLFVAGDASRAVQWAIVAAAEGRGKGQRRVKVCTSASVPPTWATAGLLFSLVS